MIRINLLPPEEKSRPGRPRLSGALPVLAVIVFVAVIGAVYARQTTQMTRVEADLSAARSETIRLKPQIVAIRELKREIEDINKRLDVIRRLDQGRFMRVGLMDELSRQVPAHVWLTRFAETSPSTVEINGVTFSNMLVADLIMRLEDSDLYENVDLVVVEKGTLDSRDVVKFTLTSSVLSERPERPDQGPGVTTDGP